MRRRLSLLFTVLTAFSLIWTGAAAEGGEYEVELPLGLDVDFFHVPKDNPMSADVVDLGKTLFFDKRLSADDTISCATCHRPDYAYAEPERVSTGVGGKKGGRNAPAIINRAFGKRHFWDGRARSLEEQALGPVMNPIEMGVADMGLLVGKLNAIDGYREWFQRLFGTDVTAEGMARAIASFERTIVSGHSAFDIYYYEGEVEALTEAQKRGLKLFKGKAKCTTCHAGFNLTEDGFHNLGVGWDGESVDLGRYLVTGNMGDIGKFKTPTLRDVTRTAPYMHDGSIATLREVIDFYNDGGIYNPFLDREVSRLGLKVDEKEDLVEFLRSLESTEGWKFSQPPESFPE